MATSTASTSVPSSAWTTVSPSAVAGDQAQISSGLFEPRSTMRASPISETSSAEAPEKAMFSRTRRWGKRRYSWGTHPVPLSQGGRNRPFVLSIQTSSRTRTNP